MLVYGGIHAAAWNEYFPTNLERLLWRFSSNFVGCSGVLWLGPRGIDAFTSWVGPVINIDLENQSWLCCFLGLTWVSLGAIIANIPLYTLFGVFCLYCLREAL